MEVASYVVVAYDHLYDGAVTPDGDVVGVVIPGAVLMAQLSQTQEHVGAMPSLSLWRTLTFSLDSRIEKVLSCLLRLLIFYPLSSLYVRFLLSSQDWGSLSLLQKPCVVPHLRLRPHCLPLPLLVEV